MPARLTTWILLGVLCGCGGAESSSTVGKTKPKPAASAPTARREPTPPPVAKPLEWPEHSEKSFLPEAATLADQPPSAESPPASPLPVYRPSDERVPHNAKRLAALGIGRYESKHLILYTDIPPELAKPLPGLIDQLYVALESYFGPLPPDREGTVFQMTGYLMADQRTFRGTGLLPDDLREFLHGRHRGAEFWMNDQEHDYYRRHLMLHEATHCFMTLTRDLQSLPPLWYVEGMAELFATHHVANNGQARFRLMPENKDDYAGLGRISRLQDLVKAGRFLSLDQVVQLGAEDYLKTDAYAWSWAVCKFLETHPAYQKRFRELGDAPTFQTFVDRLETSFKHDLDAMRIEWALFIHHLEEGYEIAPAAITFQPGQPLAPDSPEATITIRADRGWQSSGVLIEQGQRYTLTATGRFSVAQQPKPWLSEPDGISFRYFDGQPLGRLLGCLLTDSPASITTAQSMRQVTPYGSSASFIAGQTGTLYLRLNDAWNQLSDNAGTVQVRIGQGSRVESPGPE